MNKDFTSTLKHWLQSLDRKRQTIVYLVLLVVCIVPSIPIIIHFYSRVFPWWVDGGNWLKQVHAIFGQGYPMWEENTLQFDQLYFLSLASLIVLLKNEILALKVSALLVFAIRPATTFVLARSVFKSELAGLAAALLSGVGPLFYETLGWGGYPNLLGYAILPLAFYFILKSIEKASPKNVVSTGFIVAITAFSHNLTSIVFLGILGLWLILVVVTKAFSKSINVKPNFVNIVYALAILFSILGIVLLAARVPQYDFFNEAAFYKRRVSLDDLSWIAKNPVVSMSLMFLTVVSFAVVKNIRGKGSVPYILAIVSWILAPLLMSQTYLLGITIDYKRVFFYAIQPCLIMVMGPLAMSKPLIHKVRIARIYPSTSITRSARSAARALPAAFLILLSISFLANEVSTGLSYPAAVDYWYTHADLYGDKEKLKALDWIRDHTPDDAVFVAEEHFARWTEGYASRRVLMYTPPQYLFFKGETERSMAARTVLESRFELRNKLVRINDQEPYGNFTPSISFRREGVYENTLYLNNVDSKLYMTNETHTWFERLSQNPSNISYSLSTDSTGASYGMSQGSNSFSLKKQIDLDRSHAATSISYSISTTDLSIRLLNLTVPFFSAENKQFDEVYAESNNTIRVRQGPSWFQISISGKVLSALSMTYQGKEAIFIAVKPNSTRSMSTDMTVRADLPEILSGTVVAIDRNEILKEFRVSYIAIFRNSTVQPGGVIPLKPRSLPAYEHLLHDPALTVVFENSRVIILQLITR